MGVGHAYKGQILIGIIAAVLLAGGAYFLHPFTFESSYADSEDVSSTTTVNLASNLSISATDVSISDIPDADGSWLTSTSNVVVSTNNETGYKLYMSSSSDQVDLVNSDNNKYKIENLSSETTEPTFKSDTNLMNHYGFTHDNNGDNADLGQITSGTYLPVTSIDNARLIKATEEKQNISQTNVTFATKVDRSIPAGEYTNTITFTAIANPTTPAVEYMQDLDGSWCAEKTAITSENSSSITDYTYEVVDSRTNEAYWVRKFGNLCWMVENLYMPSKQALTSSDTNMTASSYTMPESSTDGFNYTSVANMYSSIRRRNNDDKGDYDGSYFTWVAAKVGVNSTGTNNDVCPKSWHMPTDAENGTITVANIGNSINNFYADSTGAAIPPVLPGYYSRSAPYYVGSGANWWSSTQNGINDAYRLSSDSSSLYTFYYLKSNGFSARCVLPAS